MYFFNFVRSIFSSYTEMSLLIISKKKINKIIVLWENFQYAKIRKNRELQFWKIFNDHIRILLTIYYNIVFSCLRS